VSYRERFYRLFEIISDKSLSIDDFASSSSKNNAYQTQEWFDSWRKALPAKVISKVTKKKQNN
jgi:hypothetical protein